MNEKFKRKKVHSFTLGEKLQKLRIKQSYSVYELSQKLHVKDIYIEALEKGHYDQLPTQVYVKGFIRSYARFFGVKEKILLQLLEKEYNIYDNITCKDKERDVTQLQRAPRFVITSKMLFSVGGVIVFLAVCIYLYLSVDHFMSSPWLVIETPSNNSIIHTDMVMIKGKTRPSTHVYINEQLIFVNAEGVFENSIGVSPGKNTIFVKSVNRFDRESVQEITVDAQYDIVSVADEQTNAYKNIFIKADQKKILLHVEADGNVVYDDVLDPKDDAKEFNAQNDFVITTNDGKNTLIKTDDEDFKSLSQQNEIVQNWSYNDTYKEIKKDTVQKQ